ncbi:flavin monoamine oxidase family protein [Thermoflexibacter ruber]|uniref:Monoamine oxidase n=1 Tax=Thermoflexibacter ruber TaxID=1003 RepID=A0A1I2J8U6_9BACT|nr:flavin monoamine oxidase family protein [Thermoflexibacter ruber]SFF51222.1 monoamine oxidase [Thermoflexibacter ruber]
MENNALLDVIVIGAGYAGLTATRLLKETGKTVLLLEARERVGGRVYTHYIDNQLYVDLGGQWIGPTQDRIYALAREMHVNTFKTYNEGKNVILLNNQRKEYTGLIPKIDLPSLLNIDFVLKKLDRVAKQIDLQHPWKSMKAKELDSKTLASFLKENIYFSNAQKVVEAGLETLFACSPSEISLLHALFYIKSGTNLNVLLNIENGAQQDRFVGGAQLIANKLAEVLKENILLSHPVQKIKQEGNKVEVFTEKGIFLAKKVIVAVPPPMAQRIHYEPLLPAQREQLLQRMPMGTVIKCMAIYERPFWREHGYSGQAMLDEGYVQVTFDNSPFDAKYGILLGFSLADRAKQLMSFSQEERKSLVLNTFEKLFGEKALNPSYYIDKCWAEEEWSRGCYVGYMTTGAWTSLGEALAKPFGNIHWAGTETSPIWNGYIEGAIRSGERVVQEVLSA